jgi:hypothetical protein
LFESSNQQVDSVDQNLPGEFKVKIISLLIVIILSGQLSAKVYNCEVESKISNNVIENGNGSILQIETYNSSVDKEHVSNILLIDSLGTQTFILNSHTVLDFNLGSCGGYTANEVFPSGNFSLWLDCSASLPNSQVDKIFVFSSLNLKTSGKLDILALETGTAIVEDSTFIQTAACYPL